VLDYVLSRTGSFASFRCSDRRWMPSTRVVGCWLTVSPLANTLGFVRLPPLYWLPLAIMLLGYVALTQVVKVWFVRRFGS
jgi:hypothetical protein